MQVGPCRSGPRDDGLGLDENLVYSFFHLCYGQVKPILEILSTTSNAAELGFVKRFNVVFKTGRAFHDVRQKGVASKAFLQEYTKWLADVVHQDGDTENLACDDFARALLEQIYEAADDFCEARKDLGLWAQKIGYRDTELLRWAAVVHRMRQSLVCWSFISRF